MEVLIVVAVVAAAVLALIIWVGGPYTQRGKVKRNLRLAAKERRDQDAYATAAAELHAEGWKP